MAGTYPAKYPKGMAIRLAWIIREGAQDFGLGGAVARFFVASVTR